MSEVICETINLPNLGVLRWRSPQIGPLQNETFEVINVERWGKNVWETINLIKFGSPPARTILKTKFLT